MDALPAVVDPKSNICANRCFLLPSKQTIFALSLENTLTMF